MTITFAEKEKEISQDKKQPQSVLDIHAESIGWKVINNLRDRIRDNYKYLFNGNVVIRQTLCRDWLSAKLSIKDKPIINQSERVFDYADSLEDVFLFEVIGDLSRSDYVAFPFSNAYEATFSDEYLMSCSLRHLNGKRIMLLNKYAKKVWKKYEELRMIQKEGFVDGFPVYNEVINSPKCKLTKDEKGILLKYLDGHGREL